MGRFVFRIKRKNCEQGPWSYTDDSGRQKQGSLYDAANSYSRRLAGKDIDDPKVRGLQITFTRRRWRGRDKRQYPHGNKGKLTIVMETEE